MPELGKTANYVSPIYLFDLAGFNHPQAELAGYYGSTIHTGIRVLSGTSFSFRQIPEQTSGIRQKDLVELTLLTLCMFQKCPVCIF